jgi:hypothetical protein
MPQGDADVPVNRRKVIAKWRNSDRHFKRGGRHEGKYQAAEEGQLASRIAVDTWRCADKEAAKQKAITMEATSARQPKIGSKYLDQASIDCPSHGAGKKLVNAAKCRAVNCENRGNKGEADLLTYR